jgi:hypothetical protein
MLLVCYFYAISFCLKIYLQDHLNIWLFKLVEHEYDCYLLIKSQSLILEIL